MGSLTTWAQIEPHARTMDIEAGLAAEVADPLWLLARQLQLGELTGDDGGSPVIVDIHSSWSRLTRFRAEGVLPDGTPAGGEVVALDDATGPIEALVEREPQLPAGDGGAWGPRVRAGRDLARRLRAAAGLPASMVAALRRDARSTFAPAAPGAGDVVGVDDERYRALLAGRAIDGAKVLALIAAGPLPADLTGALSARQTQTLATVLAEWSQAADVTWGIAVAGQEHPPSWVHDRLEYAFSIAAPPLPGQIDEIVLRAAEYDGSGVDWYSVDLVELTPGDGQSLGAGADLPEPVDVDAAPPAPGEPQPVRGVRTSSVLAAELSFPGAPADRFWEFEDAAVSLGASSAGPTDLARIVATEFGIVYSPDWLLAPVEVPVGCVASVDWVVVRDTFGVATLVGTTETQRGDGVGRQFQPSSATGAEGDHPLLVVLPSSLGPLRSRAREHVAFQRDEVANLAWAIEHTVAGQTGRGVDCRWQPAELDMPDPATAELHELIWRLATPVASTWIPMVAGLAPDGARLLLKARLLDTPTAQVRSARSRLLADLPHVREEEVTRTGCRVTTLDQLVRWHDGATFAWRGREKRPGRGEASSGLQFDAATKKSRP